MQVRVDREAGFAAALYGREHRRKTERRATKVINP
jgi:hypothetical protein